MAGTLMILAAIAVGCGGQNEVRTLKQAGQYISDLAAGNAGKWKLADDAEVAAKAVWSRQDQIEALGRQLTLYGDQACDAAEWVNLAREVNGVGLSREELRDEIPEGIRQSIPELELDMVISNIAVLTVFEAAHTIDAVCGIEG